MKHLNKLASVFCVAAMGLTALTGCEGSDMFSVNSPDWLSEKIDSIEKSKGSTEEVLVGMNEDVYTVGNTDFSSGFWTSFSKYYVVQDNQKWNAVFNLNINPSATNTYKNFALVITNDVDRGGTGYTEYGAIRFDNQPSGNSEWGDHIDRSCVQSNLTFETDKDKGVDKLGGKVTLTVDRSRVDTFMVKITNGTVTKTYIQPSKIANLNADESNTNIRCFLVPEGSYIDFMQSNVEPIGGYTSAQDKAPVSMVLNNVPAEVDKGTTLEEAMQNVSATVTFEEGVTKVIPASELLFSAINDMDKVGEKTLIVIYNKTFKGENAATPIVANAKFNVVAGIKAITVTQAPTRTNYYYYNSAAVDGVNHTLAFDPTGMVVYATYVEGEPGVIDNSKLTFSAIPATAGEHEVTITTENGRKTTVKVNVAESKLVAANPTPSVVGATDNSSAFWTEFSDDIKIPAGQTLEYGFTNYTDAASNWHNFCVILRQASLTEYVVVRADNYGWTYDNSGPYGYKDCTPSGGQTDWAAWLAAMNGAKCKVYITNNNNGRADIQITMLGNDGVTYTQSYLGISGIDVNDLQSAFTVENAHIVFGSAAARKHYTRAHRR